MDRICIKWSWKWILEKLGPNTKNLWNRTYGYKQNSMALRKYLVCLNFYYTFFFTCKTMLHRVKNKDKFYITQSRFLIKKNIILNLEKKQQYELSLGLKFWKTTELFHLMPKRALPHCFSYVLSPVSCYVLNSLVIIIFSQFLLFV